MAAVYLRALVTKSVALVLIWLYKGYSLSMAGFMHTQTYFESGGLGIKLDNVFICGAD